MHDLCSIFLMAQSLSGPAGCRFPELPSAFCGRCHFPGLCLSAC